MKIVWIEKTSAPRQRFAITENKLARPADKTLYTFDRVKQFGLKITAAVNLHAANFGDVTFNLTARKYIRSNSLRSTERKLFSA